MCAKFTRRTALGPVNTGTRFTQLNQTDEVGEPINRTYSSMIVPEGRTDNRAACKTPGKTVGVEPDPPGIHHNRRLLAMEGRLPRRPQGFCKRLNRQALQRLPGCSIISARPGWDAENCVFFVQALKRLPIRTRPHGTIKCVNRFEPCRFYGHFERSEKSRHGSALNPEP
jgi:hypothetical protein